MDCFYTTTWGCGRFSYLFIIVIYIYMYVFIYFVLFHLFSVKVGSFN